MKQLWDFAVTKNVWFWFHFASGGVMYAIGRLLLMRKSPRARILLYVGLIALGWEVGEYAWETYVNHRTMVEIYGSTAQWLGDSLGDVVGALVCALLVSAIL